MRTPLRIWTAGMAAALLLPLLDAAAHAGYYLHTLEAPTTAMVLLMNFGFAAVAVFVLGIPLFLLLRRSGHLGWATVAIGGFVLGALPGWMSDEILTGGLKGLAAALLFYAVWSRLGDARAA